MKLKPAPAFKTTMDALECLEGILPALSLYFRRGPDAQYGLFMIFICMVKQSWPHLSKLVMDEETGLYMSDMQINDLTLGQVIEIAGIASKAIEDMEIPDMLAKHAGGVTQLDVARIYSDVSLITGEEMKEMATTEALSKLAAAAISKMLNGNSGIKAE